jgi:hypothetical protein
MFTAIKDKEEHLQCYDDRVHPPEEYGIIVILGVLVLSFFVTTKNSKHLIFSITTLIQKLGFLIIVIQFVFNLMMRETP